MRLTAFDCSIAFSVSFRMLSYISLVEAEDALVIFFNSSAISDIFLAVSLPVWIRLYIFSELAVASFILFRMFSVVAEVSSILAASCWVVSELVSDILLLSAIIPSKSSVLSVIVLWTWRMFSTISWSMPRMLTTELAILPSSLCSIIMLSSSGLYSRWRLAVSSIMPTILFIFFDILTPTKSPKTIMTAITEKPSTMSIYLKPLAWE